MIVAYLLGKLANACDFGTPGVRELQTITLCVGDSEILVVL